MNTEFDIMILKKFARTVSATAVAGALALFSTSCTVEQTEEGEMPEVDVQGGNLPEYDAEPADVDVQMEEKVIEVPDVDVTPAEPEVLDTEPDLLDTDSELLDAEPDPLDDAGLDTEPDAIDADGGIGADVDADANAVDVPN